MAIQDIGSLSDYMLNGDNYERVQSDGSTLVIPTNYQPSTGPEIVVPLALCGFDESCTPDSPTDTWEILDPACSFDDSPYCIAHDATTGFYFYAYNCNGLAFGGETEAQCSSACATYLASIDGGPCDAAFPLWLIEALGFTNCTLNIDFYFVACPGETIAIPNLPGPPPPVKPCCFLYQPCCLPM